MTRNHARTLLVLALTIVTCALATPSAWAYYPQVVRYSPGSTQGYGEQAIGAGRSSTTTFVIQNVGGGTADDGFGDGSKVLGGAYLSGGQASEFVIVNDGCNGIVLQRLAYCSFTVAFDPTSVGSKGASLFGPGVMTSWTVTGTGTNPSLGASVQSLSFDPTAVTAGASAARSVTITNNGVGTLRFSTAFTGTDAGAFARDAASTCVATNATLAEAESCTIAVTFDPSHPLANAASLHLTDNSGGPATDISLSGTGTGGIFTADAAPIAFGPRNVGTTTTTRVTVLNTGNVDIRLDPTTPISLLAGSSNAVSIVGSSCGTRLYVNVACWVDLRFAPTTLGAHAATLRFAETIPSVTSHDIAIDATGTAPGFLAPITTVAFGSQRVDAGATAAQTISIVNTGTGPLTIASTTIAGSGVDAFAITSSTCGSPVPALGSCTIGMTFDPSVVGELTATLRIAHDAVGAPSDITLGGSGAAASVQDGGPTATTTKPAVTRAPVVRGTRRIGARLTCAGATWTGSGPRTLTYSWQHRVGTRWVAIRRATKASYLLVRADAGTQVRCVVRATNAAGTATGTSVAVRIVALASRR